MAALSKGKLKLIAAGMCLSDDGNKAQSRGLCWRCLNWAKGSIERGELSEQQLIDDGDMLPPKRRGRKAANALAQKLAKRKTKP